MSIGDALGGLAERARYSKKAQPASGRDGVQSTEGLQTQTAGSLYI